MSTPIDLTQLPAPSVVEVLDFEAILATCKAHLVSSLLLEAERAAGGREGLVRHSDTD